MNFEPPRRARAEWAQRHWLAERRWDWGGIQASLSPLSPASRLDDRVDLHPGCFTQRKRNYRQREKTRHPRLCYGNKWRIIYLLVIVSPVVGKERSINSLNWLRREIKTQKDDFSLLQCFKVSIWPCSVGNHLVRHTGQQANCHFRQK